MGETAATMETTTPRSDSTGTLYRRVAATMEKLHDRPVDSTARSSVTGGGRVSA